jgi:hypothetical protein
MICFRAACPDGRVDRGMVLNGVRVPDRNRIRSTGGSRWTSGCQVSDVSALDGSRTWRRRSSSSYSDHTVQSGDDLAIEAVDIANGLRRWLASKCYGNWAEEDPTSHEDLPPALA